jgi:hypothetical protein
MKYRKDKKELLRKTIRSINSYLKSTLNNTTRGFTRDFSSREKN